jgi:O-antigen ligase
VVYTLLAVRWRWRTVLRSAAIAALALPAVPSYYWERMGRTLAPTRSSFETYGSFIRLYGWQAALRAFQDHPLFGVGYLGFRFISDRYNDFRLVVGAEDYYLEIAVGMGICGLILLGVVIHALLTLDRPVRASAPEGSFGHELARRHRPLMLALMAANLTGDNFMGMVGLAQLAIWCALLIRSGHLSVSSNAAV